MVTEAEELQAKDFLKRAEVRTMKKDLQVLRESDALKERYKIVNIKTLEEQRLEQEKKLKEKETAEVQAEKEGREKVLGENANQERLAEKNLKEYATEQERQQIFILESQRLELEKQADKIDKERDPALRLEKNKLLLEKRNWEAKLNSIKEDNKKLDAEYNFLDDKIGQSQIPSEKKALEQRRWEIEDQRKGIEKKAWEVEKQLENIDNKIKDTDKSSQSLIEEKNSLNQKILGIDKSLREIYSTVISRVEEKRRGQTQEQIAKREAISKAKAEKYEKVQREQWTGTASRQHEKDKKEGYLSKAPASVKKIFEKSVESEEEQRKKFLHDVEAWSQDKDRDQPKVLQQKNIPPVPEQPKTPPLPPSAPPIPPVPHK